VLDRILDCYFPPDGASMARLGGGVSPTQAHVRVN
jgi:hypothetical protein